MTILRIEHPITDFSTWRAAFGTFDQARREAGVRWHTLSRPVDDDCYVMIDLGFSTTPEAERFLAFLRERVWSNPAAAPALVGSPRTRLLEIEDQLSPIDDSL